jgi:peptidyl-prolyl cis-trans isomerase C
MKRAIIAAFLVPALGLVLSCSRSEEEAVGKMGDEIITAGMVEDEYLSISPGARPVFQTIEDREQFVRDIMSKEILEREAHEMGLDGLPEIQQARQATAQRKGWDLYYEDNVRSKVGVSEDELRETYDMQRHRYHLGWIFVRSQGMAKELAARIDAGEDFESIAALYSVDASRSRGGDIGVRALGTLPAVVEKKVSEMSPGEVSGPIAYGGNYLLVKVYEREDAEPPDFEALRQGLVSMVRTRKETELQRNISEELRKKYGLTFNDDVVRMIADKTRALYPREGEAGKIPEFSDEELDRIVAEYDGGQWSVRTYVEKIKNQADYMRPAHGTDGDTIKNILRDFIGGELWMREIQNRGYLERPEVVKAVDRAVEEALVTLMHQQVVKDVSVGDDQIREFYEENKDKLWSEAGTQLAVITTETQDEAAAIYQELDAGVDFAKLAREMSFDEASRSQGGKLRTAIYDKQLEAYPDLYELVTSLDEGGYSEPIRMPAGFMPGEYLIVKVVDRIEAEQLEFNEIKHMLGQRLAQIEQDSAFGEWLSAKMLDYDVRIYTEPLARMDFERLRTQE